VLVGAACLLFSMFAQFRYGEGYVDSRNGQAV
jgi:hypothetical protein